MKKLILFSYYFVILCALSCKKDSPSFVGTYNGNTSSNFNGIFSDQVVITQGSNASTILISDTKNSLAGGFTANISGSNFTIPPQLENYDSVSGTGSLNGNQLTLNLNEFGIINGGGSQTATFTGTRQ